MQLSTSKFKRDYLSTDGLKHEGIQADWEAALFRPKYCRVLRTDIHNRIRMS